MLPGWDYQKILLENVLLEKAFSDSIRSGFLVPFQKSRFFITFSNSIRSGLIKKIASAFDKYCIVLVRVPVVLAIFSFSDKV